MKCDKHDKRPFKFSLMAFLCLALSVLSFSLCACGGTGKSESEEPVFPFTSVTFESTKEDILALEGTDYETYDSVYGGVCYTYPKTYEEMPGTVKYMLDGEDRLMCVAWACSSESEEELHSLYTRIEQSVQDRYGKTSSAVDKPSNYGSVWYRSEGNIIISTMVTSSLKALQYAYLNPAVSTVSGN